MSQQGHDPRAIANYLVKKAAADVSGKPLTIVHLLKLVYFAHGWHLGRTGQPLINRPVEAWKYGPVIPEVYDAFRRDIERGSVVEKLATNRRGEPFDCEAELDEKERRVLDDVYEVYAPLSGHALSDMTHQDGSPWSQVKSRGPYALIQNSAIRAYYHDLIKKTEAKFNKKAAAESQ